MEESLTRTFLGEFFWVLIPCKQHQNASGCGTYNLFAKVIGQLSSPVFGRQLPHENIT